MKRSYLALAVAAAALAISASGPALATEAGATAEWMFANRDSGIDFTKFRQDHAMRNVLAVPAAESANIDRVAFTPAPRLTYAVLYTTTSPSAMAFGLAGPGSPLSIA